ncbi:MAG: efflux RND transporter periplasmic adaptor subunit, partial [Epibacterium sp.]|nr:efflux RND transporter periplasmic adaptor subunit [Epibacterium sp.]NQX75722.1 efflux RND transporter periplasmic adaptor subunit [Epibacterium sp.]
MKYACFAALSLFLLVGCGKPPPLVPPEVPTVVVVTTEKQQVNPYLERIGRVKAREDSTLNARVTGYITEIPFKEGDFVTEGTRLIQIDPTPYQLAAQKLEASLARAKAETKLAVDNFERGKELVKKKVISEVQFEELRTKLDAQKSMEDETAASLASAKWDLQQTTIDAPFDGIVSDAQVSIGDLVQANGSRSLVTIVTVDPMEVYFDIDEGDMITFKRNEIAHPERANRTAANVKLRLPNNTLYEHVGRIDFV